MACSALLLLTASGLLHASEAIRIGVLSHRGDDVTHQMWDSTANYLSYALHPKKFEIVPLDFDEVEPAVRNAAIDFLLVNSGIYVNLEEKHRISRIVTLDNGMVGQHLNVFGGVIFTRADRDDINQLADISGRSFIAVDETSLGGFQMAWGEMVREQLSPSRDFSELDFGGTHDKVVMAVLRGEFDVGTVRTNILERMAAKGDVELDDLKIINGYADGFPYLRSTPLYPEWPFSKLQQTSNQLARQVAVALLNMQSSRPTGNFHYAGWTVPLDYQEVHDLFRRLQLPPYDLQKQFTLLDAIKRYRYWLLVAALFLLMMAGMSTWVARLNRQLKKSKLYLEHQHDLVLDSVCDGIYGVDLDGNCTFVNRSMETLTGWEAEDLIGRNQHRILHHTHADGTPHQPQECPVYQTFRTNEPRFVEDDLFWKKDGSGIPVEYSSTPMQDHKGETVGSVVVFRDISERKQAEEETRRHQSELAHMARLNTMGEMASGIAHELNQPLTAIATNAYASIRMLESGAISNDKLADVIEKIGFQAERSGEIIRQMRQFVRKELPQRSLLDLNEMIEEVLLLVRPEVNRGSVTIERHLDPSIKKVMAQRIQIEQVILNLVKNAIEAVVSVDASSRKLTITTEMGGEHSVIVSVEDSGPGISSEMRDSLFDPFVTSKKRGLGIGLSISKGIIEAHQGNLYLDSEPGQGAIFRFALPLDQEKNTNEDRQ
ncbi:MAG: PhnD/SsuA/transferrin family substrate-binding protein [Pseudomonadota bacterium]